MTEMSPILLPPMQELIPANLASVVVRESDFAAGLPALELSPETQAAWNDIWLAFKAGK